jgi:hypothetical protein
VTAIPLKRFQYFNGVKSRSKEEWCKFTAFFLEVMDDEYELLPEYERVVQLINRIESHDGVYSHEYIRDRFYWNYEGNCPGNPWKEHEKIDLTIEVHYIEVVSVSVLTVTRTYTSPHTR